MVDTNDDWRAAWPRDMAITIDQPRSLLYLLFVREAWGFAPLGAPALDPAPDPGHSRRPPGVTDEMALARWAADWQRALEQYDPAGHAPTEPDEETKRALRDLDDEQLMKWATRRPTEFWDPGVDLDALSAWSNDLTPHVRDPLERTPERLSLPALVEAWRTGVDTILELPFDGYLSERLSRTTLLVSVFTRSVPDLYTRALIEAAASFDPGR